jgi:hypothetical protein
MTGTDGLALATRGLEKRYGSRVALAGLDLSVPNGVVYGFLGPNGAGKTTTMRLLTGLIYADAGSIDVLGRPFGRGDRHRLFDAGALIESPAFYPFLSGRQNLVELAANGAPVPRGRVDELLELTGLREREKDKVCRVLARHEATSWDRGRPAQRPEAAAPRRAVERPRSGRHRRDAGHPAEPSPTRARPSSSRAICSARSSRWSMSSASSRRAVSSARVPSRTC